MLPPERVEDWIALPDGTFAHDEYDMAAFLHEADLEHLCARLPTPTLAIEVLSMI